MDLLIDLGNTRLKWALHDADGLRHGAPVVTAQPDWSREVAQAWAGLPPPRAVVLAAVASPERTEAVATLAHRCFPHAARIDFTTPEHACGVRNGYTEPARLGVDRFLAMVGARARHRGPCVVAGAGTALAVDVLDAQGQHRGGAILPSAAAIERAVLRSTARVRAEHAGAVSKTDWGRSTEDGLATGAWLAQAALIDRIAEDASAQLGGPLHVLLHGGAASTLLTIMRHTAELVPDVVFEGMVLRLAEWRAAQGASGG